MNGNAITGNAGQTSGSHPAPELAGSGDDLAGLARRVHALYCRSYARLDYGMFRQEWVAAARMVAGLGVEPETFFKAQAERRIRLDPEDLATPAAAAAYSAYAGKRNTEALDSFIYAEKKWQALDNLRTLDMLWTPLGSWPCSFRVAAALRFFQGNEPKTDEILGMYGDDAVEEIKLSPSLLRYLRQMWGLGLEAVEAAVHARRARKGAEEGGGR